MTVAGQPAPSVDWLPVENPASGTSFADASALFTRELATAVAVARDVQSGWAARQFADRCRRTA